MRVTAPASVDSSLVLPTNHPVPRQLSMPSLQLPTARNLAFGRWQLEGARREERAG